MIAVERYRTRPGVVLAEIAGEYLLVATRAALDTCPYLTQLNESSAFLWRLLERGATAEELAAAAVEAYDLDGPEDAVEGIRGFLREMIDMNYVTIGESA